jgi:hypothetical protein
MLSLPQVLERSYLTGKIVLLVCALAEEELEDRLAGRAMVIVMGGKFLIFPCMALYS